MDHVEAAAGKVAVQLDDRPQIQEWRDVPADRKYLDFEPLAPQQLHKGLPSFAGIVRAGQHHLVALLPQVLSKRQDEGHLDARLRGYLKDIHAAGKPFIVFRSLGTTAGYEGKVAATMTGGTVSNRTTAGRAPDRGAPTL